MEEMGLDWVVEDIDYATDKQSLAHWQPQPDKDLKPAMSLHSTSTRKITEKQEAKRKADAIRMQKRLNAMDKRKIKSILTKSPATITQSDSEHDEGGDGKADVVMKNSSLTCESFPPLPS